MHHAVSNLRDFLRELRRRGEVVDITVPCDAELEIPEIHRRVALEKGRVLFFHNVKGSSFPLVTNLFGTRERVELAFGRRPGDFVRQAAALPHELVPPSLGKIWKARSFFAEALRIGLKETRSAPVLEREMDLVSGPGLRSLPALKLWPEDGGRFVTLPLVYTEDPEGKGHNLGMYRIQIYDERTTGMHWQIGKGGGFHHHRAEAMGEALPVTLFVGGPPALILSAIAPLPEAVGELMLASLLLGERLKRTSVSGHPHPLIAECEFAFCGFVPPFERRPEGPFGDHYGYYSLRHDYPVFHVKRAFHRRDAIFPATVVGKPRQEDFYIGEYLQDLLAPLFPVVMPSVISLRSYGETGFHGLAAARVKDRYAREAVTTALRILGEGQLGLQKFIMVTDGDVDLTDFRATLIHFLQRTNWKTDLFVLSNVSQDTLDYTGPKVNEGSKGIWLALGPACRDLCTTEPVFNALPRGVKGTSLFVPGCLVVSGERFSDDPSLAQRLAREQTFSDYELIVLVDDHVAATSSVELFLWNWFTRFEPAADIVAKHSETVRFHVQLTAPVVFDARMKPWYPAEVEPDLDTVRLVDGRWGSYFSRVQASR